VIDKPKWLDLRDALAIHDRQIARYGGSSGVRDQALLESALARSQNLFAYGTPSLVEMTAACATGIIKNHPFVDGNKRTGFVAAVLFLEYNAVKVVASESDATAATLVLASSEMTEAQFARWLEANSQPTA
jgi:death-on-curing protein